MNNYYIYMHKNKINGKIYIGQTCQKPEYRWNNGKNYINCSYFYKAIQKYGWDNFEHIILEENLTLEQANEKEEYYIKLYNSINPEKGYNLQKGGNNKEVSELTKEKCRLHALNLWANEEHKQKMSEIMKQKWQDPEYIKKQQDFHKNYKHEISEEGKKRISEARKKYIQENGTPTQGKGHTLKTRKKISEAQKGENNSMYGKHHTEEWKAYMSDKNSQPVYCIEADKIFKSKKEAANWCGLKSSSGISDCIAGRKKSAGKHPETGEKLHWKNMSKEKKEDGC